RSSGAGIAELLEIITLQSDMESFKGDPAAPGSGFVIESDLNPKQGIRATLIIKDGTIKLGMYVAAENAYAPIRTIENYKGALLESASFSSPARIVGWS